MIPHNLTRIYEKIGDKTNQSSLRVRKSIMEVFRVLKDMMNTYPETSGFLLNKFGNIEVKPSAVRTLLKRRIMSDEQRVKWEAVLESATQFKEGKKISVKKQIKEQHQKDEREQLPEQEFLCTEQGHDTETID